MSESLLPRLKGKTLLVKNPPDPNDFKELREVYDKDASEKARRLPENREIKLCPED